MEGLRTWATKLHERCVCESTHARAGKELSEFVRALDLYGHELQAIDLGNGGDPSLRRKFEVKSALVLAEADSLLLAASCGGAEASVGKAHARLSGSNTDLLRALAKGKNPWAFVLEAMDVCKGVQVTLSTE